MSDEQPRYAVAIRRIVVAVDNSAHGLATLEQAVAIAAKRNAVLEAIFVEDLNLFRLIEHPLVYHVGFSGVASPIEASSLEASIRTQTRRLRETVNALAARSGIPIALHVKRGRVTEEILAAAIEADLMLIGWSSAPTQQRRRIGTTARAVARQSHRPVLILRQGTVVLSSPVSVVFDGSSGSERAMLTAADLAMTDSSRLTVLLAMPGESDETESAVLRARATALLAGRGLDLRFRTLAGITCSRLGLALAETPTGALVIASDNPLLVDDDKGRNAIDSCPCPILISR